MIKVNLQDQGTQREKYLVLELKPCLEMREQCSSNPRNWIVVELEVVKSDVCVGDAEKKKETKKDSGEEAAEKDPSQVKS